MNRLAGFLLAISGRLVFASTAQAAPSQGAGSYLLTATSPGGSYAPTFTGNGTLGVRVPPSGEVYAAGTVPAQSELAGSYTWPTGSTTVSQNVQQRAYMPPGRH